MKRVKVSHPLLGVLLTVIVGGGIVRASNPTTQPDKFIEPGISVGPVKLGMTDAELEQAMGKPATVPWADAPLARQYPNHRMSVLMSRQEPHKVAAILGGSPQDTFGQIITGPFEWRTAEGLGMGSSANQIETAFGKADVDREDRSNADFVWRSMRYLTRGIEFGLKNDRVIWLAVRQYSK